VPAGSARSIRAWSAAGGPPHQLLVNMNNKNTALSRTELMELLWSKPTTRIAAEYGVTVTAVIAACAHLDVTRPRAGHWSAVKFGTAPSRPLLPPIAAGQPQSATLPYRAESRTNCPTLTIALLAGLNGTLEYPSEPESLIGMPVSSR
jgi:hypothetical protein